MKTAKTVIEDFIKKMPSVHIRLKGYQAAELWPKIIDQDDKSWVSGFSSGTLTILTENPSFGQEISLEKKEIIEKLNKGIGKDVVNNIRVKVASRPQGDIIR